MFKEKLYITIRNIMIYWIMIDIIVGFNAPIGIVGKLLGGFIFGLIMLFLPDILGFFKFPINVWAKMLVGGGATFALILFLSTFMQDVLVITEGYIGDIDFIIFYMPKVVVFPNKLILAVVTSVLLNLCSIILSKLNSERY